MDQESNEFAPAIIDLMSNSDCTNMDKIIKTDERKMPDADAFKIFSKENNNERSDFSNKDAIINSLHKSTLSVIHDNVKNVGVALESDPNQNDSIVDDERSNIFCIINELVQNAAENIETRPINHYIQTPEEQEVEMESEIINIENQDTRSFKSTEKNFKEVNTENDEIITNKSVSSQSVEKKSVNLGVTDISNLSVVRFKEIKLISLFKKVTTLVFRETLNPVDYSELDVVLVSTRKNKEIVEETSNFKTFTENEFQTEQNKAIIESNKINQIQPQRSFNKLDKEVTITEKQCVKETLTKSTNTNICLEPIKVHMVSTGTNTTSDILEPKKISPRKILRESDIANSDSDVVVPSDNDSTKKHRNKIKISFNNFIPPGVRRNQEGKSYEQIKESNDVTRPKLQQVKKNKKAKKLSILKKKVVKKSTSNSLSQLELKNIIYSKSIKKNEISNQNQNNKKLQLKLKRLNMDDLKNAGLILKPIEIRNNRFIKSQSKTDSNKSLANYAPICLKSKSTKDSDWRLGQVALVKKCSVKLTRVNYEEYKNNFEKSKLIKKSSKKIIVLDKKARKALTIRELLTEKLSINDKAFSLCSDGNYYPCLIKSICENGTYKCVYLYGSEEKISNLYDVREKNIISFRRLQANDSVMISCSNGFEKAILVDPDQLIVSFDNDRTRKCINFCEMALFKENNIDEIVYRFNSNNNSNSSSVISVY